jgi:hypothetical protein
MGSVAGFSSINEYSYKPVQHDTHDVVNYVFIASRENVCIKVLKDTHDARTHGFG